ncbi:hypothetical protein [Xenorhabdus bovienii]|uniref:hypothetical protein n=1 Tax=Xenorhabdus bovienii TaxID=40576 RepID=UPI003DA43B42
MSKKQKIILKLGGTSPDNLSLARLAQYLSALSSLYGSSDEIHFDSVTEGSAELNSYVSNESAYNSIKARINEQIVNNSKSYKDLINLITKDNLTAEIYSDDRTVLGVIQPLTESKPLIIKKKAKVQGQLYSVGGRDDTIPVRLLGANNEVLNCEANQHTASQLGKYLFKKIRVHGMSEWENKNGEWKLKKLKIEKFEILKDIPLGKALRTLADDEGNNWKNIEDRDDILQKIRSIN